MKDGPPEFRPKTNGPTAVSEERVKGPHDDEEDKLTPRNMVGRALAAVTPISVEQAGRWFLLSVAVAGWVLPGVYWWSHSQWGWGPCPHRQQIDMMYRLAAPPAQPGGAPTITLPPPPGQPLPVVAPRSGGAR